MTVPVQAESYPTGQWGAFNGAATFWGNISISGKIGLCLDPGAHPPTVLDNSTAAKACGAYDDGQPDKTANPDTAFDRDSSHHTIARPWRGCSQNSLRL